MPEEPETYVGLGSVFTIILCSGTKRDYLLASLAAREVVLVNMRNGARWCQPLKVDNIHSIPFSVLKEWAMKDMSFPCDMVLKTKGGG